MSKTRNVVVKRFVPNIDIPEFDPKLEIKCPIWANIWDYNDKVMLHHDLYHHFFPPFDGKQSHRRILVVKHGKRKIYRMAFANLPEKEIIALTQLSLLELGRDNSDDTFTISAENKYWSKIMYFYKNPYHEIRVSFKLAILSLIIALISIIPLIT